MGPPGRDASTSSLMAGRFAIDWAKWSLWRTRALLWVKKPLQLPLVTSSGVSPEPYDAEYESRQDTDASFHGELGVCTADSVLDGVLSCKTARAVCAAFANVPSYGAGPLLKKQIHMVSCNDELDLELAEGGGLVSRALRCRRTPDILIASSKGLQEAETPPLLLRTLFPSYSYSSLLTSTSVGAVPANQLTVKFAADGVLQEAQHRKANNASATSTQRGVTSAAAAYIGTPWSGAVHGSSAQAVFLNPGEPERDKAQRRIPKCGLCDRKGHEACQCFLKPPHLKPDSPRALVVAEPQLVKTDPTKRAAVMASGTLSLLAIESHRSTWQLQTRIASSTHLCFRRDCLESLRQIGERASLGMGDAKYHVSACVGTVLLALEVNGVQAEDDIAESVLHAYYGVQPDYCNNSG